MADSRVARDKTIAALVVGGALVVIGIGAALWRRVTRTTDPAAFAPRHLIKPGARVAVAGDSIGVGLAAHFEALATAAGAKFVYSGAEKNALIPTWSRSPARVAALLATSPDVILLSLGTNDAAASKPTAWAAEVERLTGQLTSGGAELVWIGSPSEGLPNLAAVREMIVSSPSVRSGKVMFFDAHTVGAELASDRVHLTGAGYKAVAKAVWGAIT